ncbi:MAG TPA: anthranilate phosphoribosyltransferase [Nitrospiria bacterium]|nr:anthranilate phosphoribosyltransferase [Nitrospiria bacterium]
MLEEMPYFIHKVGAGEKASQDLTPEEAERVARMLLSGGATPAQAGGFLVGMRVKGETPEEMLAFTRAARETHLLLPLDAKIRPLDLPVYAGKKNTFHAIVPAGMILAAAGVSVLLHGFNEAPGRIGCGEVLKALGICADFSASEGAAVLEKEGFVYLDVSRFNPSLHRFQLLRVELGVRTVFNAVSRMVDPASSAVHLVGVSHPPYLELTVKTLKALGSRRAVVLRGVEGGPEPSMTGETKGLELVDGEFRPLTLSPASIGLPIAKREEIVGGPPDTQAETIRKIFSNGTHGPYREWTLWTAAVAFYAAGTTPDLAKGLALAAETIENGAAFRKLSSLSA